jgi:hypothetical protein
MNEAINAAVDGSLLAERVPIILRAFLQTAKKVTGSEFVFARLSTHLRDTSGHPRVFNSDQETVLSNRILHLEMSELGQIADQVRRAAYSLAEASSLRHLLHCKKNCQS